MKNFKNSESAKREGGGPDLFSRCTDGPHVSNDEVEEVVRSLKEITERVERWGSTGGVTAPQTKTAREPVHPRTPLEAWMRGQGAVRPSETIGGIRLLLSIRRNGHGARESGEFTDEEIMDEFALYRELYIRVAGVSDRIARGWGKITIKIIIGHSMEFIQSMGGTVEEAEFLFEGLRYGFGPERKGCAKLFEEFRSLEISTAPRAKVTAEVSGFMFHAFDEMLKMRRLRSC